MTTRQIRDVIKRWTTTGGGLLVLSPDDVRRRNEEWEEAREARRAPVRPTVPTGWSPVAQSRGPAPPARGRTRALVAGRTTTRSRTAFEHGPALGAVAVSPLRPRAGRTPSGTSGCSAGLRNAVVEAPRVVGISDARVHRRRSLASMRNQPASTGRTGRARRTGNGFQLAPTPCMAPTTPATEPPGRQAGGPGSVVPGQPRA